VHLLVCGNKWIFKLCFAKYNFFAFLYKDASNSWNFIASATNKWKKVEHRWVCTEEGKRKRLEKNLFHCHFVRYKYHMHENGIEPETALWEDSKEKPEPWPGKNVLSNVTESIHNCKADFTMQLILNCGTILGNDCMVNIKRVYLHYTGLSYNALRIIGSL
jgi:hypothetical protein